MVKLSLCNYSDACILMNDRITISRGPENTTDANKQRDERNKEIIFGNSCTIY